jgi:hypothetical protein
LGRHRGTAPDGDVLGNLGSELAARPELDVHRPRRLVQLALQLGPDHLLLALHLASHLKLDLLGLHARLLLLLLLRHGHPHSAVHSARLQLGLELGRLAESGVELAGLVQLRLQLTDLRASKMHEHFQAHTNTLPNHVASKSHSNKGREPNAEWINLHEQLKNS